MTYRKWKPSKKAKQKFINQMTEIEKFCIQNGITQSRDSYYFNINDKKYRVSNHTIEASNKVAFNEFGEQTRKLYHPNGRDEETEYITASKTRIIEIYNNLLNGKKLNKRGYIIN